MGLFKRGGQEQEPEIGDGLEIQQDGRPFPGDSRVVDFAEFQAAGPQYGTPVIRSWVDHPGKPQHGAFDFPAPQQSFGAEEVEAPNPYRLDESHWNQFGQ